MDVVPLHGGRLFRRAADVYFAGLTQLAVADFNAERTSRDCFALLSHLDRVAAFLLGLETDHAFARRTRNCRLSH